MFKVIIYGKKIVNWIFNVFSKMVIDTGLKFSGYTNFLMTYRMNITRQAGLNTYFLYMFKVYQFRRRL